MLEGALCEDEGRDQSDAAKARDHQQSPARAFLVAQQLRICLPMQESWVQSMVWEDPICHGATKPLGHNY